MPLQQENSNFAGGFATPAIDAAHAFRAAMQAMARPGTRHDVTGATPPGGISAAAGALLLTLCDPETGIYLAADIDSKPLREWIAFHTGAPIVSAVQADFALGGWSALMPLSQFPIGTSEYPDRSATLIVEIEDLQGEGAILSGPGIQDVTPMVLPEIAGFQGNAALYPQGLDFFFTSGSEVTALPRSTRVQPKE